MSAMSIRQLCSRILEPLAMYTMIAGIVALVTARLVDGYAFIIVGALSGAVAGALLDDPA